MDQPIQLLYPLELHCNDYKDDQKYQNKEINISKATATNAIYLMKSHRNRKNQDQ